MRILILRYKVTCKINMPCYFFILKSNILFNIDNRDYGHYRHSKMNENCNVAQKELIHTGKVAITNINFIATMKNFKQ